MRTLSQACFPWMCFPQAVLVTRHPWLLGPLKLLHPPTPPPLHSLLPLPQRFRSAGDAQEARGQHGGHLHSTWGTRAALAPAWVLLPPEPRGVLNSLLRGRRRMLPCYLSSSPRQMQPGHGSCGGWGYVGGGKAGGMVAAETGQPGQWARTPAGTSELLRPLGGCRQAQGSNKTDPIPSGTCCYPSLLPSTSTHFKELL